MLSQQETSNLKAQVVHIARVSQGLALFLCQDRKRRIKYVYIVKGYSEHNL